MRHFFTVADGPAQTNILRLQGTEYPRLDHLQSTIQNWNGIEIDLDVVRRQRAQGQNGLGQVLKSFRDREVEFDVYDDAIFDNIYLNSLGPLKIPERGSRAGLDGRTPAQIEQDDDLPHDKKL